MSAGHDFNEISVGDFVVFARRFTAGDWESFSSLSGDDNPLHWNAAYAAATSYGRPIVPLHLAASPLSAIAGSMLPGRRALYLGSRLHVLSPIFFDESITYSARVAALSPAGRTLSLNAIGFRGRDVLLEAEMLVQVRDEDPGLAQPADDAPSRLRHRGDQRSVVVAGATGAIGREVVHRLSGLGHAVVAIGRGEAPKGCRFVQADLATEAGRAAAARAVAAIEDLGVVFYLASPPVDAPASELFGVNFEAFRTLAEAALPVMLGAQYGRILLVGSKAVQTWPAGMETYAAAKAASSAYADYLERQYSRRGVNVITVAPDFVDTSFSVALRTDSSPVLLPEEVADALIGLCQADARADASYILLTQSGPQAGRFGFTGGGASTTAPLLAQSQPVAQVPTSAAGWTLDDRLGAVVREVLDLSQAESLAHQALDITPGWDSLRHLELMLAVEREMGIHFSSSEIAETRTFPTLAHLVSGKLPGGIRS